MRLSIRVDVCGCARRAAQTRLKMNHIYAFGVCITYTEPLFIILYYYYKYQYQIPMIINIFISTRVLCAVLVVTFNRMRERFPLNTWWIRQHARALKYSKRLRFRRTLLYAFVACVILSNIKSNLSQTSSRQGNRPPPRIVIVCYRETIFHETIVCTYHSSVRFSLLI